VTSSGTPEGSDRPFKIEGQDPLALSSLIESSMAQRLIAEPTDSYGPGFACETILF